MKLSRTDVVSLLAIGVSGAIGVGLFGPWHFTDGTIETTVLSTEWGADAVVVTSESGIVIEATAEAQATTQLESTADAAIKPLIYVNGIRIAGDIEDLDPDAIDRIEVLKGAAATNLYGDEAQNGVIQIYLKADGVFEPGR